MRGAVHNPPETDQATEHATAIQESHVEVFSLQNAPVDPATPGISESSPAPEPSATDRRRVGRSPKPHLFVTLCHWGMTTLLGLNLLTGMRLGWGYVESPVGSTTGLWGAMLTTIAPRGTMLGVNIITLHVMLAFLMFLVAGVYVGYLVRSRTTRRLQVTRQDIQKLLTGLRTRTFWHNKAALWSANVLTYWLSFLGIGVLVVTGVALYRLDWGLSAVLGGYNMMRFLHAVIAYLLIPYVGLHMVLQWCFGRFWTIFQAQQYRPHMQAGLLSLVLAMPIIAGLYLLDALPTTLTVMRFTDAAQAPVLDGDPSDAIWSQANAVTVRNVKGVNNPHDSVDVLVKAVHDGAQIYFLFQWDDPDVSAKRYPLVKTEHGWKVLQTAYERGDENLYYEDKLSVYFTNVVNGSCAATCHLGVGPHSAKGDKHGVHYTRGEVGDIWHWKSVRTDHMGELTGEPGFMDDQHFKAPDPVPVGPLKERYTAGYHVDPKTGGGYDYNFTKIDPDKPLAETYVRPKMLPATGTFVTDLNPATSEQGATWWIHKSQGIPYSPEADTFPVGAMIPNILIEPFQGDRADVRAKASWQHGRWTLEARRVLDTKSLFDVPFVIGKSVYLTVATYNRTQTRHGEHITPVKVMLQP